MKTLAEIPNLFNRFLISTDGIPEWLKKKFLFSNMLSRCWAKITTDERIKVLDGLHFGCCISKISINVKEVSHANNPSPNFSKKCPQAS